MRILFIKIPLIPAKPKKAKKPTKKKKKREKEAPKEKNEEKKEPNIVKKLYDAKGVSGLLDITGEIARLAKDTLKDLFAALKIRLSIYLKIAGKDAADTAVKYGYTCSGVYPALKIIDSVSKLKVKSVDIIPDFSDNPSTEIQANALVKIRILSIIKLLLTRGIDALKLFLSLRREVQ